MVVPAKVASHHAGRRPTDLMQAQYSVPFMLATAAILGLDDPRRLDDALVTNPRVLELCDGIGLSDGGPAGPQGWGAELTIRFRDGRRFELAATGFPGCPETPMGDARLRGKFRTLVRDDLADPDDAFDAFLNVGSLPDLGRAWPKLIPPA